jgi:hypothetical protein
LQVQQLVVLKETPLLATDQVSPLTLKVGLVKLLRCPKLLVELLWNPQLLVELLRCPKLLVELLR